MHFSGPETVVPLSEVGWPPLASALVRGVEIPRRRSTAPGSQSPQSFSPPGTALGSDREPGDDDRDRDTDVNGKQYVLFSQESSWREARDHCSRLGGRLALPANESENRFLTTMAKDGQAEGVWLGASDLNFEQWLSVRRLGTPISTTLTRNFCDRSTSEAKSTIHFFWLAGMENGRISPTFLRNTNQHLFASGIDQEARCSSDRTPQSATWRSFRTSGLVSRQERVQGKPAGLVTGELHPPAKSAPARAEFHRPYQNLRNKARPARSHGVEC